MDILFSKFLSHKSSEYLAARCFIRGHSEIKQANDFTLNIIHCLIISQLELTHVKQTIKRQQMFCELLWP